MAWWHVREALSLDNKLRRSYYELLRDELDQFMLTYSVLDSYKNFKEKNIDFPFVEKRELKPRARIPDIEYDIYNSFLVIFVEGCIPKTHKKYIKFFDLNKTIKTNLLASKSLDLSNSFDRTQKYMDSVHFMDFVKKLLPVDYALLIQRDVDSKKKNRYSLSHFHVRIDWPVADAAEDLASNLRYISKDLYEKGDKYADDLQKKLFEYYGMPVMCGGRRTAAIVAAQYLQKIPCITTVYASSSESRALIRISERGISKTVIMKFSSKEIKDILKGTGISNKIFRKHYMIEAVDDCAVCMFQVAYNFTNPARLPDDGKLRDLKPDINWQTVDAQYIIPLPGDWKHPPIPLNTLYT